MKQIFTACYLVLAIVSGISCKKDNNKSEKEQELLLGLLIYTPYEEIGTGPGTFTLKTAATTGTSYASGRSFSPTCPALPGSNGELPFTFFRRTVASNNSKLLVVFMGGGACWSNYNCFGSNTTTYFNYKAVPSFLLSKSFASGGIFNKSMDSNPLKDYDIILVPHCSGDLFYGSKNHVYQDPTQGNKDISFPHKGHDNVLAVLKYVQEKYPNLTDVFVTGFSAGGYAAVLNYPHIRETVAGINPNVKVGALTDAGVGVIPSNFFNTMVTNWNITPNLPTWVTGLGVGYFSATPSLEDYTAKVASYYPNDKIGQYNSAFDAGQRYFYNVMTTINGITNSSQYSNDLIPDPIDPNQQNSVLFGSFGKGNVVPDGSTGVAGTNCDWVNKAVTKLKNTAVAAPSNYRYFIAPGDAHTITVSDKMYSLSSGGSSLLTWIQGLVNGSLPGNVRCYDGGHSCVDSNLDDILINRNFGRATSNSSYLAGKDLSQTCNTSTYFN